MIEQPAFSRRNQTFILQQQEIQSSHATSRAQASRIDHHPRPPFPAPSISLNLPLRPQLPKSRSLLLQQNLRVTKLDQSPLIHNSHKVKLNDSFQFMSHRNDSMVAEFFVNEILDLDIGLGIDAVEICQYKSCMGMRRKKGDSPASSFIHNQHSTLIFPQQSPSDIEKLLRPLAEMDILHHSIEASFGSNSIPKTCLL
jgi:hypothetical protein